MSYLFSILLGFLAASFGGWVGLLVLQVREIRRGQVSPVDYFAFGDIVQQRIDSSVLLLSNWLSLASKQAVIFLLIGLRRIINLVHGILAQVEKYFSRLISWVEGRKVIDKRRAASLWLTEVKNHKEEAILKKQSSESVPT